MRKKNALMKLFHTDKIMGGHCGQKKLYAKLRSEYYWKGMTRDIAKYVQNCEKCLVNKPKVKTKEAMAITVTPQKPFDLVILDTIGPYHVTSNGNAFAVTLLRPDQISDNNSSAQQRGKYPSNFRTLHTHFRSHKKYSDKNAIVKELCEMLNIQHDFSTAYHHETLGAIERNHRVLNEYLRSYMTDSEWDIHLKYFTHCYNISYNATLNHEYTPFELVFAKKITYRRC